MAFKLLNYREPPAGRISTPRLFNILSTVDFAMPVRSATARVLSPPL